MTEYKYDKYSIWKKLSKYEYYLEWQILPKMNTNTNMNIASTSNGLITKIKGP